TVARPVYSAPTVQRAFRHSDTSCGKSGAAGTMRQKTRSPFAMNGVGGRRKLTIILVIEDEPPVLVLAESLLKQAGYLTVAAARVAEAKPILESDQELHAIFTDISLADDPEGGLEIGRLASKLRPGLPLLYTTAGGITDAMIQQFVSQSAFLAKPYTGPQLVATVANLLRS